jgi:hypothetical protein
METAPRETSGRRSIGTRASILAAAALVAAWAAGAPPARPDFDAGRLAPGTFRYRNTVEGRDAGASEIRIRRSGASDFVFTNRVAGAFAQSWEAIAARDFAPRSARLTMGEGKDARDVFELLYRGGRVTGFARSPGNPARRAVDESVAADTVDQRIDWAAVMSLPELVPGAAHVFHVYDPGTGHSRITARVLGVATIAVPAGRFVAARLEYRIEKNRGTETYELFAAKDVPRLLVKERFPNGSLTELVEVRPP